MALSFPITVLQFALLPLFALPGPLAAQPPTPRSPGGAKSADHEWRAKLDAAETPKAYASVLREIAARLETAEDAASFRSLAEVLGAADAWGELDRAKVEPMVVPAAPGQTRRPPAALPALWALRRCEPRRADWSVLDVEMLLHANDVVGAVRAVADASSFSFEDGDSLWTQILKGLGMAGVGLDVLQGIRSGWVILTRLGFLDGQLGAGIAPPPLSEREIRFLVQLGHVHEAMRIGEQKKCLEVLAQLSKEHTNHPLFVLLLAETHASFGPAWDSDRASSLLARFRTATADKQVAEATAAKAWNVPELLYYHGVLTGRRFDSLAAMRRHAEELGKKVAAKSQQVLAPDFEGLQATVRIRSQQAGERLAELQTRERELADVEGQIERKKLEIKTAKTAQNQDILTELSSQLGSLQRSASNTKLGVANARTAWERQQKIVDLCEPRLAELQRERQRR